MNTTTILIVENEATVASDLSATVRQLGYEVTACADSGQEAIALVDQQCPDLVLIDIRLNGTMDGIAAAFEIRQRHDVPVIYLAAHFDPATLSRAKETGPFGYIIKPFEERDIATQIELALLKHQSEYQLRQQREWVHVTLSSIGDAVIVTDPRGEITFINPVAVQLTGWSAAEAVGKPLKDVFHIVNENTRVEVEDPVQKILRTGTITGLANHTILLQRRGGEVPIDDSGAPLRDEQGHVQGVVLIFRDITERRRAEKQLEHRLQFEQLIARISSELAGTSGPETDVAITRALGNLGAFTGVDRAYVFRLSPDGALLDNTHEWCAAGVLPQIDNLKQISVAEELPWFIDQLRRHQVLQVPDVDTMPPEASGERTHLKALDIKAMLAIPISTADGIQGFLGFDDVHSPRSWSEDDRNLLQFFGQTLSHVIERNEALKIQEDLQTKLTDAVELASLGHWEFDMVSDRFIFNDQFYRLYRTTAEQVGGYTMTSDEYKQRFVHPDEGELMEAEIHEIVEKQQSDVKILNDHRMIYGDGETGYVSVRYTIVRDSNGNIVKTFGVNQDITERKRAEKEQEKLREQLLQSQKIESVGRLAGGVAHDFNNMLEIIIGHAELAMEQVAPSSPMHDNLHEIHRAAMKSADLTRQLLAFARKQIVSPEVFDLNDKVTGMIKMLRRLIGEDIELAWQPGADLWPVKMDPAQTDQVLANLCVNARDAINGVGKITIETKNTILDEATCDGISSCKPGHYVLLTVSDTGCGMDADTLANLFEPFFTTKGMGEGTGLGLSTVYGVVKQNYGIIDVLSQPGQGAEFRIYLPRCLEEVAVQKNSPAGDITKGTGTILVVEDEVSILEMAKAILERLGYTALTANNPKEALTLVERHPEPIHLLITDVVMPEMNGKDLTERIRKLRPDIKVLFMSGYTTDTIAHRGVLKDNIQFLQKPFSISALAKKVSEVIAQSSPN